MHRYLNNFIILCVYNMCIYTYTYIYVCLYTCIYIHIYLLYTCIYKYIYVLYLYTHVYTPIHVCICTYMHIYVQYMRVYVIYFHAFLFCEHVGGFLMMPDQHGFNHSTNVARRPLCLFSRSTTRFQCCGAVRFQEKQLDQTERRRRRWKKRTLINN